MLKKAQSTLEYGVIIAVVVAGLVAMQGYIKRGLQGRLRTATDQIGDQFSPNATEYDYTTETPEFTTTEQVTPVTVGNLTVSETDTLVTAQKQIRTGTEKVLEYDKDYWK
jgi:Flp pilus assembly pilin Flp